MKTVRHGDLDVVLTGGTDREGGGDGPLVVLLHGYGAPGTDLVGLWRVLDVPRHLRFAFPAAPVDLGFGGRAWWPLDTVAIEAALRAGTFRDRAKETPEGLPEAREALRQCLHSLVADLGVPEGEVVLGGFSQGSMLALEYAVEEADPLSGLVLLSTTLLSEHRWRANLRKRAGLRVLQSHGRGDPLLSFDLAEVVRDAAVEAGLDVRFVPFSGGHEIPPSVLDALGQFLRDAFEPDA